MIYDLTHWPVIDLAVARIAFPQVPLAAYPELSGYSRAEIHEALMGQGGLFLAADMAKLLSLRPGMQVLDLGCGAGVNAIYLAKNFGVTVYAVDAEIPADLMSRAAKAGVGDLVFSACADARKLPFEPDFFDAVFSMGAFFYFGTDDFYPTYLLRYVKRGGAIAIGSPCYRAELTAETPEEFLLEFPACLAVHSPDWWRRHFENTRQVEVKWSALHPRGAAFWTDRVGFLLEEQDPRDMPAWKRDMLHSMIRMLNRDTDGFVSHFMLLAQKTR